MIVAPAMTGEALPDVLLVLLGMLLLLLVLLLLLGMREEQRRLLDELKETIVELVEQSAVSTESSHESIIIGICGDVRLLWV